MNWPWAEQADRFLALHAIFLGAEAAQPKQIHGSHFAPVVGHEQPVLIKHDANFRFLTICGVICVLREFR